MHKIIQKYTLLYLAFCVFSCCSIFNKLASAYPILSKKFVFFYGLNLFTLIIYALLWQQVLKNFELSTAYAHRPIVTLLGMFWGILLFHEEVTWNMIIGALIIVAGLWVVVTSNE